jgi:hypothetical protein
MLHIVLILGWLIVFGLAVYLATRAVKHRLMGRQRRKFALRKIRDFKRHHHFDEKQQQWVRKDGVVLIDEVSEDRRLNLVVLGVLLFVLWEGYWIWEIAQRYSETNRLQLPYVFLFFILVVIPMVVYSFFRRRIRRLKLRIPEPAKKRSAATAS